MRAFPCGWRRGSRRGDDRPPHGHPPRGRPAFMVAWVEGLRDLPGNPAGVTVERFGGAVALACETLPDLDFVNTVHGLDPARRAGWTR